MRFDIQTVILQVSGEDWYVCNRSRSWIQYCTTVLYAYEGCIRFGCLFAKVPNFVTVALSGSFPASQK